jgi:hypothetical protein
MSDRIVARSSDLEWREVDDEVVLLDLLTQNYLALNRTGAALWPMIVEGVEHQRLVQALVDSHGVDDSVAKRDVDALVDQLRGAGLLQAGESGAPSPTG